MKEIKEKLHEQENEIYLLKELIVKGFKGIENLSQERFIDRSVSSYTATAETNESEMINNYDANNNDTENQSGPELPLPVPNLF